MNGRLIASLLWLPVVLVPPLRTAAASLARFLWPSRLLGRPLAATALPLVCLVVIGWGLMAWLAGMFLRRVRVGAATNDPLLRSHGGDSLTPVALAVTAVWFLGDAVVGKLSWPMLAAAALVVAGVVRTWHLPVEPEPEPPQVPEPPEPLPRSDEDETAGEDSEDDTSFIRFYRWLFDEEPYRRSGRQHTFAAHLEIPRETYDEYKGRSHDVNSSSDYVTYVDAELGDEVVSNVSARIRSLVEENHFDPLAEIHLAMSFTLAIRYAYDDDEYGTEYPKFPVETLVDKRGDCEDHAILCGAILHRLGHRVALVLMDTGPRSGHAALAVEAPISIPGVSFYVREVGADMFYCEVTPAGNATTETTTDVQWWLGMDPPESASNFKVYPIGT